MGEVFKVPAPVGEKRRALKRPLSPQPSTSSAPDVPYYLDLPLPNIPFATQPRLSATPLPVPRTPLPLTNPLECFPDPHSEVRRIIETVFSRADDNHKQNQNTVIHLRGVLSSRRRRDRYWRKYRELKAEQKYAETIKVLEPLLMQEVVTHQRRQILINTALTNFANTVDSIADNLERVVGTEESRRWDELTKIAEAYCTKRRALNPIEPPVVEAPLPDPVVEEEINRKLREETEAAVEALLTGDKTKEAPPNNFSKIFQALKMV